MYIMSPSKLPVIIVRLNFLGKFCKNTKISNDVKIRPVATEIFHANGQTDGHDEANNPPEKKVKCSRYRPGVAQRVGRGIALPFRDGGTRRG